MKQQTAVDWLVKMLYSPVCNGFIQGRRQIPHDIIEQAKAMWKDQIIDAHIEGQRVFDKHDHTQWTTDQAEKYYNETYKL
jgi:hypothetical protein